MAGFTKKRDGYAVIGKEDLKNVEFDYLIIAAKDSYKEILAEAIAMGISRKKNNRRSGIADSKLWFKQICFFERKSCYYFIRWLLGRICLSHVGFTFYIAAYQHILAAWLFLQIYSRPVFLSCATVAYGARRGPTKKCNSNMPAEWRGKEHPAKYDSCGELPERWKSLE